jgi:hypothetical protein
MIDQDSTRRDIRRAPIAPAGPLVDVVNEQAELGWLFVHGVGEVGWSLGRRGFASLQYCVLSTQYSASPATRRPLTKLNLQQHFFHRRQRYLVALDGP